MIDFLHTRIAPRSSFNPLGVAQVLGHKEIAAELIARGAKQHVLKCIVATQPISMSFDPARMVYLDIDGETDTFDDLRDKYQRETGVPPYEQRWVFTKRYVSPSGTTRLRDAFPVNAHTFGLFVRLITRGG